MAKSTTKSSNFHWQGRHDKEDGALGQRVHHIVKQQQNSSWQKNAWQDNHAANLLGFCCDAGVACNKGRIGAKKAPDAIRRALANMAWHHKASLLDLGNVECKQDQLEQSQAQCAALIASALPSAPVITLGGGHEVAWASFQGLAQHLQRQNKPQAPKIGIINFDAHFDLRVFEQSQSDIKPSSGTPFYQIYHYCAEQKWPFQYACLGVSRASNTQALFKRADELAVFYLEDRAFTRSNLDAQLRQLQHFIDRCDYLYLSIDLDVFPAATAPGVSAPAAMGVSLEALFPFIDTILQQQKLIIADIAEYNPNYDLDDQTARLAARLCWEIANGFATRQ